MSAMKLITLLLALLLTACGGGDPEDGAGPVAAASTPAVKVMLYGDSTQLGYNTAGVNAGTVAEDRLTHTGYRVSIAVAGVIGSTAQQLLNGTDGIHPLPFDQAVQVLDAQIVGLRFGNPDFRSYSTAAFKGYMEDLTTIAEAAGMVVILQTPSPLDVRSAERDTIVQHNVRAIREVAAAHPNAVLCDHRKVGMTQGFENSDGVHPTAEDYRIHQGPSLTRCIKEAMAKLP